MLPPGGLRSPLLNPCAPYALERLGEMRRRVGMGVGFDWVSLLSPAFGRVELQRIPFSPFDSSMRPPNGALGWV